MATLVGKVLLCGPEVTSRVEQVLRFLAVHTVVSNLYLTRVCKSMRHYVGTKSNTCKNTDHTLEYVVDLHVHVCGTYEAHILY